MPVLGVVSKHGTKTCTVQQGHPYTRAYSTGNTEHLPPGTSAFFTFHNGANWLVTYREKSTPGGGGFWNVQTDGSLNDPGTFAGCAI